MIVVKVGGSEGISLDAFCEDAAALVREGKRLLVVHGGSHETNRVAEALGTPPQFVTSPSGYTSRHTDRATLEIFEMVYCGSVNKGLVERFHARGVNAIGLSGMDAGIWRGPRKKALRVVGEDGRVRVLRDGYTGRVQEVNTDFLRGLLERGLLPLLTPPAISLEGEAINVDGDRAAAATAVALEADALVVLSNVPGLLRDPDDETSLVESLTRSELEGGDAEQFAKGRMRIKLLGAREALDGGVPRVILGDARGEQPIRRALEGAGTVITGEAQ